MNLENLRFIEDKYNFKYSKIYKKLVEDNMLDWGQFGANWSKIEYPKLKDKPPLLLYGSDFEIISFDRIMEEIDCFSDEDDYRQTKKQFYNKFIPFGQTGAGDLYCFYLNEQNEIESIILVWHDCNEVNILADNLQNFIFRQLLQCVIDPYEDSLIMNGNFKENINKQLATHKRYLNNQQIEIIEEIYNRNAKNLLDHVEFNKILKANGFNVTDNSFEYQEEYEETNQTFKQIETNLNNKRHHIEYRLLITSLPKEKLKFIKEIRKLAEISISDLLKLNKFPFVVYGNLLSVYDDLQIKNFSSSDKEILLYLTTFYADNVRLEYKYQLDKNDNYQILK